MYDRIIENMILFEGVDPNRVYILGYSAGGDGTYQIAPRMSDRWAAANMSAGHPNGVNLRNLYHVPLLIQMGEKDTRYNRHSEAARYYQRLEALQEREDGGYFHDVFIHVDRGHGVRDNLASRESQVLIAEPIDWLENQNRKSVKGNSNAIDWITRFERAPLPRRVIWDLKTVADRSGVNREGKSFWPSQARGRRHYWISSGDQAPAETATDEIIVYYRGANLFTIEKAGPHLEIMLTQRMVDMSQPLHFSWDGVHATIQVRPSLRQMIRTVIERGDPEYIFAAVVKVSRNGNELQVVQVP